MSLIQLLFILLIGFCGILAKTNKNNQLITRWLMGHIPSYDYIRTPVSQQTVNKQNGLGYEVLPHRPYSTFLSLADSHPFRNLDYLLTDCEEVSKNGERQSPINIHTVWTSPKSTGPPLELINYSEKVPVIVTIDHRHYTIKITPHPNIRIAISGGGLPDSYVLQSAHFHFGSEHLIDSERLALEAHLVHYREIHGNHTYAATNDPEGIAVLGTLFFQARINSNLEKILKGTNCCGVKLRFRDFLPHNLDFYRYYGSLTTPPYSEAVVWTVFQNPVSVSKQQLHSMKNYFPKNIKTTYRNVQPLKGRQVERWEFKNGLKNKI